MAQHQPLPDGTFQWPKQKPSGTAGLKCFFILTAVIAFTYLPARNLPVPETIVIRQTTHPISGRIVREYARRLRPPTHLDAITRFLVGTAACVLAGVEFLSYGRLGNPESRLILYSIVLATSLAGFFLLHNERMVVGMFAAMPAMAAVFTIYVFRVRF